MTLWRDQMKAWWVALVHPERAGHLVLAEARGRQFEQFLAVGISAMYAVYGVSMGLFRGCFPAIVSALKLPFLYLFTLAVCFPLFYVLNAIMGPRLRVIPCLRLLLLATSANAAALASYAPVSYFFTLTTSTDRASGYRFLVLMHVLVFALAGVASLAVIGMTFRTAASALGKPLRPSFLITYGILYAFVGTQMSWILRPWIGSWHVEYQPFRKIEGSFIEAVWRLLSETFAQHSAV